MRFPAPVVTVIAPVVAPTGTVVVIFVAVFVRIAAEVPWNATTVAPERFTPVMVTDVPITAGGRCEPWRCTGTPAATTQ